MESIEKEFVPYDIALELKQLKFDEPCFGYYWIDNEELVLDINTPFQGFHKGFAGSISAPLYQQAFRWFREKHNLRSFVDTRVYDVDSPYQWIYDYQIKMGNGIDTQPFYSGDFDSYEEAELACLRELIKIIKGEKA